MLLLWLVFLGGLRLAQAVFVDLFHNPHTNMSTVLLRKFLVYVAIDPDIKMMKFVVNSAVDNRTDPYLTTPLVTDVDPATNRYTTLHVDVTFMGRPFISENLRFCNILAVKNTLLDGVDPRYLSASTATSLQSTATATPIWLPNKGNRTVVARRLPFEFTALEKRANGTRPGLLLSLASSNSSIELLFSNSLAQLVQCPLYQNDSFLFYYQANISSHIGQFGSYSVQFTVVSNNEASDVIGGGTVYITPSVEPQSFEDFLFFGVLALCLAAYILNLVIIVFSPHQESQNPFFIEASAICNKHLLRHLELNPYMIISYLQFGLFMSALDVRYPGFFQELLMRIRWCALLSINIFSRRSSLPPLDSDNVFIASTHSGLQALALYNSNGFIHYSWPSFMVCLTIWIAGGVALSQLFITLKAIANRPDLIPFLHKYIEYNQKFANEKGSVKPFSYSVSTNLAAILGHVLREFLTTFGLPFLVLTMFMLSVASNGKFIDNISDPNTLQAGAFNRTMLYQDLDSRNEAHATLSKFYASRNRKWDLIPTSNIVLGSIFLFAWCLVAASFVYYYHFPFLFRGSRKSNVHKLYTSVKSIVMWAYLYNQYDPSRSYFTVIDLAGLFATLLVIGVLQRNGLVQVILLVLLEFAKLGLLIIINPYFLRNSWHSLPLIMSFARFLIATLCIAYVRQLEASELLRSYVAYAQLIIHAIVAVIYVIHLIYCLGLTITAIVKGIRANKRNQALDPDRRKSIDSLVEQFEFRQVKPKFPLASSLTDANDGSPHNEELEDMEEDEEGGDQINYYRSKSEKALHCEEEAETTFGSGLEAESGEALMHSPEIEDFAKTDDHEADAQSFNYEQSIARISHTDYTTRESDRIYQKYFCDKSMDPEMRELWESRLWSARDNWGREGEESLFANLWRRVRPTEKKGFEVMRRRPLVVKTLPRVSLVAEELLEQSLLK